MKEGIEYLDLILITIITIFFSLVGIAVHFIDIIYHLLSHYANLAIANFLRSFIFLYLIGLLWFAFRRWKQTERKKKELEEITSNINPDVLIVVDKNNKITMCSNAVERVFGYKVEEVVHQKLDILYSDSLPAEWNDMQRVLEKSNLSIYRATGRKKDGTEFPLELTIGNLHFYGGSVVLLRDITKTKMAEDRLQSAYKELNQIFNASTDGICVIDTQYNILRINETFKFLLGYKVENYDEKLCYKTFKCSRYLTPECSLQKILNGDSWFGCEIEFERMDGKRLFCIHKSMPFRDTEGKVIGVIESYRDISERKDMEENLQNMSREAAELVSGVRTVTQIKDLYDEIAKVKAELARYVAPPTMEIVEEMVMGKKIHAGELVNITVLFSDIRGFTSISENMDPDELFKMLNLYLSIQIKAVEEYSGTVDKLSGDEVMAVFSGPDMAESALKCAMAIINHLQEQRPAGESDWIGVGIGINTGPAYLGPLGSESRKQFTHIGTTVNIAARLCGKAKKFEVLFGKTTQELVKDKAFNYRSTGNVPLKGLSAPIEVFQLIN